MKSKSLIIYSHLSTFVKGDIEILSQQYDVESYHFKNEPSALLPLSLIRQFFHLLFTLPRYKLVYVWFVDYHSFIPTLLSKLYRKKILLVVGGYDICREKKYSYGSFTKKIRGYFTISSMKMATALLAVSKNVERTLKAIVPKASTYLLYNGIVLPHEVNLPHRAEEPPAPEKGCVPNAELIEGDLLTVAFVTRAQTFYIKGIDRLVEVANRLPTLSFTLIGSTPEIFSEVGVTIPQNLKIINSLEHSEVYKAYGNFKGYLQLSRRESFSLALAEALYHHLPPIISATGGMAEVVGPLSKAIYMSDTPLLKEEGIAEVVSRIKALMENGDERGGDEKIEEERRSIYRERVEENFTLTRRSTELYKLIESI